MTVTLSLFAGAGAQFFDNNGVPLTGGLIYTYAAGTTTPAVTYTSYTGFVSHTNPIVLDSAGRVPSGGEIWLLVGQSYKFILKTSANVLIATYDNIPSAPQPPIANDAASISYEQGNTVSAGAFVTGNSYMIATVGSTNFTAVGAINNVVGTVFIATGAGSGTGNAYSSRTVQNKLQETISVKDFGAVGDGVTDDTVAINNAIIAVNAAGGGIVNFPEGTYLVGDAGNNVAISLLSNVTLNGCGINASIIKLKNSGNAHVINATSVSNVAITNLTVDGNRASQSLGVHCIRGGDVDGYFIENVEAKQAYAYGIGFQTGTFKRIKLNNVYVHDTGLDGIDLKNKNSDNEDVQYSNITVRQWGLDTTATVQTAMDIRGVADLVNIDARNPANNTCVGIRFRQGEVGDVNGLGGHKSSLTNFFVDMGATTTSIGLNIVARDVTVSNGHIQGGLFGVSVQDSGARISQVTVTGTSGRAWILDDQGSGLDADDCVLTACHAHDCAAQGFTVRTDRCQLIGCYSYSNDRGMVIEATADNTRIIGGDVTRNTTSGLTTSGTNDSIRNVNGFVNEVTLISPNLAIDATGSKAFTIAHGMDVTPALKDVSLALLLNTAVVDYVVAFFQVTSVDSNNVSGRVLVSTASATGGAVINVGVKISTKAY